MLANAWNALLRTLGGAASPAGPRGRLLVLIYHRVLREFDPLQPDEPDAGRFEQEIALLARNFAVLPLSEAVARLREGRLPARAACVTFDDGYANNVEVALPILLRHGVPATFFIAVGYLDGGVMFNDKVTELVRQAPGPALDLSEFGLGTLACGALDERRRTLGQLLKLVRYRSPAQRESLVERLLARTATALPRNVMMTADQVRSLRGAGMEIGAHTVTHPILTQVDLDAARSEMAAGKEQLEAIVRDRVRLFAYPNGRPGIDYGPEHVQLAREVGFQAAVSTATGTATEATDPYQIPRVRPWDRSLAAFGLRLVASYWGAEAPSVTAAAPGTA